MMPWFVYILKCSDCSYYVGHTSNIETRLKAHNCGKGAKHTAIRLPVTLIYHEPAKSKAVAMKREQQIKHWSKSKKEALVSGDLLSLKNLSKCRNHVSKDLTTNPISSTA
jgi:predicted GIY-YIG superfamily endonuclease